MSDVKSSVDELMEMEREACRRFQAGDVDGVMDMLMEDALVCPPGMEAISGRENQRVVFKQLAATEGVELSWEPVQAVVSPSDEMAYVFGTVWWRMPGEDKQTGKYISVWVKHDGAWKNTVEIRNANA